MLWFRRRRSLRTTKTMGRVLAKGRSLRRHMNLRLDGGSERSPGSRGRSEGDCRRKILTMRTRMVAIILRGPSGKSVAIRARRRGRRSFDRSTSSTRLCVICVSTRRRIYLR
uniref:(northern house mosquito) hypothetical protein n=1 Tax=Culex pipiens TaxID=7175 RepID=A0A8D8BY11_CULPI